MTRPGIPRPYHGDLTRSSGIVTSSQAVCTHECVLVGLIVFTDEVNTATVTVYDNPSAASGPVLAKAIVAGDELMGGEVHINCWAENGLYVQVQGVGAEALIRYIP